MSTLSHALKAISESFQGYEKTGLMLSPEAVQSISLLLAEAGSDASKLEKMLERRLKSADRQHSAEPARVSSNVLPFQRRMQGEVA